MRKNTIKTMAISALIIAVGGLTLGYAALQQVLNINTTAKVKNAGTSWNVHFQEGTAGLSSVTTGDAEAGTATLTDTTFTLSNVVLKAPGDSVTYQFWVANDGEIDAKLSSIAWKTPVITGTGGSKEADEALIRDNYEYTITYANGGAIPAEGDVLDHGNIKVLEVKVTLKSGMASLPSEDVTISGLGATLTYVQK